MKKFLQHQPVFICLLLSLLLSNCSLEESITLQDSNSNPLSLNSRIISLEELESIPGAMEKLNSLKERKNKRLAYSSKYNFTIDTDRTLLVEKGKYKSLSFPVYRDEANGYMENLFLHPHKGGYLAFLARYKFTPADLNNLDKGLLIDNLISKTDLIPLDDFDIDGLGGKYVEAQSYGGGGYEGIVINVDGVCYRPHNYGPAGSPEWGWIECPGCECPVASGGSSGSIESPGISVAQYQAIIDLTYYNGNGGGGGGSGSGGTGGGGTGGGGTGGGGTGGNNGGGFNPGNFTSPFNPVEFEDIDPNNMEEPGWYSPHPAIGIVSPTAPTAESKNCADLKNKSQNANFQAKMAELKTKAGTQNFESAYSLYQSPVANGQNPSTGLTFSNEATGNSTNPEVGLTLDQTSTQTSTNAIGFIHCHLDNGTTFKVFSFTDIIALAKVAEGSTRPTQELAVYLTTASGTFALKINSETTLTDNITRMILTQSGYERDFKNHVNTTQSLNEQILGFLNFIKEEFPNGLGVDLYQQDTSGDWEKLELTSGGTQIKRKKC